MDHDTTSDRQIQISKRAKFLPSPLAEGWPVNPENRFKDIAQE
jgi:hypothetical protein